MAADGGLLGAGLMSKIIHIAIAPLLLMLIAPASARQSTFRDATGRVTGTARTDSNGVTTFHDAGGRVTGSIKR